jgi:hypothetical protein
MRAARSGVAQFGHDGADVALAGGAVAPEVVEVGNREAQGVVAFLRRQRALAVFRRGAAGTSRSRVNRDDGDVGGG